MRCVSGPFEGHTGSVCSVAFSPDGKHIVSGSDDATIRVWNAEIAGVVSGPFEGHRRAHRLGQRRRILPGWQAHRVCSRDNTIRIWDTETGAVVSGPLKGTAIGSAPSHSPRMASTSCLVLVTRQYGSGILNNPLPLDSQIPPYGKWLDSQCRCPNCFLVPPSYHCRTVAPRKHSCYCRAIQQNLNLLSSYMEHHGNNAATRMTQHLCVSAFASHIQYSFLFYLSALDISFS